MILYFVFWTISKLRHDLKPYSVDSGVGGLHTSYLSRTPRIYSCKFFLAGVNFYRFNAKNWQSTVYFFTRFFGVNFILQKFCPCKKNDKYEVCQCSPPSLLCFLQHQVSRAGHPVLLKIGDQLKDP